MNGETYIRAYALIGLSDLIEGLGGNMRDLLEMVDLPEDALTDLDKPISYKRYSMILDIASRMLNYPSLGIEWTLSLAPNFLNAGPLTLLQFVTRDFQEWIEVAIRSLSYHTNGITFCKVDTAPPGHIAYRFLSDPFVLSPHQQTEHVVSLVVELARKVIGDPNRTPSRVRFSHAQPADTVLHERVFGCPIEFDCDHDEIQFPQEFLDMPTNGSFRLLQPLVSRFLHFRIERLRRYEPTTRTTVSLVIRNLIGTGSCTLEFVAQAMGQSPKRLQRALAAESLTFSQLFEDVRQSLAERFLIESGAPIERIAGLLDYSSNTAFTLAFKRWKGMTPLKYRKQYASEQTGRDLRRTRP